MDLKEIIPEYSNLEFKKEENKLLASTDEAIYKVKTKVQVSHEMSFPDKVLKEFIEKWLNKELTATIDKSPELIIVKIFPFINNTTQLLNDCFVKLEFQKIADRDWKEIQINRLTAQVKFLLEKISTYEQLENKVEQLNTKLDQAMSWDEVEESDGEEK